MTAPKQLTSQADHVQPSSSSFLYPTFQLATGRQYKGDNNWLPFVVVVLTGAVLRSVSPKFGKMVAEEANRKGYYRCEVDYMNMLHCHKSEDTRRKTKQQILLCLSAA